MNRGDDPKPPKSGAADGPPPPMPDQLPQQKDPQSAKGERAERAREVPTKGGHTIGTKEYEEFEAAENAEPPETPPGAEPDAPEGKLEALSGLVFTGHDGERRQVTGGTRFDASAAELKSFREGVHYKRAKT